jgi:hypothetical protein
MHWLPNRAEQALAKWATGTVTAMLPSVFQKRAAEAAWMRDKIVADVPASADQVHLQQI